MEAGRQEMTAMLSAANQSPSLTGASARSGEFSPQATSGRKGRLRATAALAGAAVIGAGIAVVSLAVAGAGPAAHRSTPARLEQTIVDQSATLSGALAFSPNGLLLAVTNLTPTDPESALGSTSVYNLATGRHVVFFQRANGGGVNDVTFSPDGRTLVVTGDSNTRPEIRLPNFGDSPLAFSPGGRSVAAAGNGPSAYVWDTVTGKLAAVFRNPIGAETSSLTYSPDGRTLAVCDYEGNIYLWNVGGLP
jgi:WD40 repeat protein